MRTVTSADGTPIAYERSGNGPPLVLVHGTAGDHTRWELGGVRPALADHYTVYAMDRRGRGRSGDTAEYDLEREYEDVKAVIDGIEEPVHLLGHSFGAICALEASLVTENLQSLIIYEPPVPWELVGPELFSEEIVSEMEALLEAGEAEAALIVFMRDVLELPEEQLAELRSAPSWQGRVAAAHTVPREERAPADYEWDPSRFAEMDTPTLLLLGSESPTWANESTRAIHEALPKSRIAVLEGQGHVAMNTAPALFLGEVRTFLRQPEIVVAMTSDVETVTSTDGTTIAYERTGSGPPLVLVHGTTADHTRWEPILPALAEHFTVYAMDRRGRGASGDTDAYAVEQEVDDVVTVVEMVDAPVTLLGHSFGALCALEAALRTDHVCRLLLYEPPLPVGDHDPDTADVLDEMTALVEAGENEQALVHFFRDIARVPQTELDALRSAPNWPARVDAAETAIREERARKEYEFDPARFDELSVSTLLLAGSESTQFLQDATNVLNDVLPNSRISVLEGQAHAAMNTAPELFIEQVLAFIHESTERIDR